MRSARSRTSGQTPLVVSERLLLRYEQIILLRHFNSLPGIPFRSVPFRASELALPRNSECLGISTFFRGITEAVPSLFRGIFSERNSVPNPTCTPHPHQAGLIFPSWWMNASKCMAIVTLCVLSSFYNMLYATIVELRFLPHHMISPLLSLSPTFAWCQHIFTPRSQSHTHPGTVRNSSNRFS